MDCFLFHKVTLVWVTAQRLCSNSCGVGLFRMKKRLWWKPDNSCIDGQGYSATLLAVSGEFSLLSLLVKETKIESNDDGGAVAHVRVRFRIRHCLEEMHAGVRRRCYPTAANLPARDREWSGRYRIGYFTADQVYTDGLLGLQNNRVANNLGRLCGVESSALV